MKPVKFRAWQDNCMRVQATSGVYDTKAFLDGCYEDCVLMQSTGLKDKNGVEIYEGDIVLWGSGYSNAQMLPVNLHTDPRGENHLIWRVGELHNYWDGADVEVVGNTYENPELLK